MVDDGWTIRHQAVERDCETVLILNVSHLHINMKNTTIKVTELINGKLVCRGKLILIKTSSSNGISTIPFDDSWYKPIIVSETEDIMIGDLFYWNKYHIIETCTIKDDNNERFKILALPEQIPVSVLQFIMDRKMKDGDEVYLECEELGLRQHGINVAIY